MKTCPICRESVQDRAALCHHCRYTFTAEEMRSEEAAIKREFGFKAVLYLIGGLALAGLFAEWIASGGLEALERFGNQPR